MIVRVHRLVRIVQPIAQELIGAVRDHFVYVHVVRRTRARLDRINDELICPLVIHDLLRAGNNRFSQRGREQAQVAIHFGGSALDYRH